MGNMEVEGSIESADRLLSAFQTPQHLTIYDIRGVSRDVQLSVMTMVGLINRPQPRVYLLNNEDDVFWLKAAFTTIPQKMASGVADGVLDALLTDYRSSVQGVIIYDPRLPDSVNIATTLAGQRDGIVVSPGQAELLQTGPYALPILADLRSYGWGNRLQAYAWAVQHLLGNASQQLVAGMAPTIAGGLRSFLVANRAFVYWLDSRNVLPDPRNGWQSEHGLLRHILASLRPGAVHLGWFIDEPSGVLLTSRAAIPVLASDHFFNLEVWTSVQAGLPVPSPGHQQEVPLRGDRGKGEKIYVSFTMSDGDNLQYDQHRLLRLWSDEARGSVPIGWTLAPALVEAAPTMATYYQRTATPNDELIAGPSGAGYMFPSQWPTERLAPFLQRTGQLMQRVNMTTLEVLDEGFGESLDVLRLQFLKWLLAPGMRFTNRALQERFVRELAPFGVRGILSGAGTGVVQAKVIAGVPVYQNLGLAGSVYRTLALIKNASRIYKQRPLCLNIYLLAWTMTPTDLKKVAQQLGDEYELVTPGTLLTLFAEAQFTQ